MHLSEEEVGRYERDGYVMLPDYLTPAEVERLRTELPALAADDTPSRVLEKDSGVVRALHGCHLTNRTFDTFTRLPRMVRIAEQIVGNRVYVYQLKINFKAAFGGDVWQWHQDFIFWRKEDGMPGPHVANILVFLDEVNEFNGPLMVIPGSHRHGLIDVGPAPARHLDPATAWVQNVSADLKYTLGREVVTRLVREAGIVAPKGPAGTAMVFHPNLAHASVPNLSPFDRTVAIVTYNSIDNVPVASGPPRPEFLVSRDTRPIELVPDDALAA